MRHLYYPTGEPVEPDFDIRRRCLEELPSERGFLGRRKRRWRVVRGLVWHDGWLRIEAVETGWTTDLASIPKLVQWLIPKRDADVMGYFHDDGYRRVYDKDVADALARMIGRGSGLAWWRAGLARRGLRWLGWPAWIRHWRRQKHEA